MSDAPTADPDVEPDGNQDEQTNGEPDQGGDSGESDRPSGAAGAEVDRSDVERSARDVERIEGHSRQSGDTAGVNPSRSQQERRPGAG
jgi:hypothetical protein